MTLMVALVGEQPLPNLMPVRHFHPESLLLLYSKRTEPTYRRLKAVLEKETQVDGLETDAFNIITIVKDLKDKLDTSVLSSQKIEFNLTGGTKAMSLAVYQVAEQRSSPVLYMESEGKNNRMYRYSWENHELRLSSVDLLPERLQLKDFFDVQLGVGKWEAKGPARDEGGHFEIALAEILRDHGYEVMAGVHLFGTSAVEVDIALRFENQFGILEAKLGAGGTKLFGLQQLSTATQRQFLGTYTKKFYVITEKPEVAHEAIREASDIKVISLPGYVRNSDTLPSAEAASFLQEVDEAFKGKSTQGVQVAPTPSPAS